ncbi:MAG TPA: TraR/DksA C4-type zinc finger protein [Balneolales bacterium]|nr:TraR/DksA C4-type zinc finger protein [Balneolales bacterium]
MTDKERDGLRDIITEQISSTQEELKILIEMTRPVSPDNAIGRISRMDAINNKTINDAALRNQQKKLKKLERALERMNDKNFGKCMRCGEDIPFGRLKFMPHTTKCVKCA